MAWNMLAITTEALDAIKLVEAASGTRVRISTSPHIFNGSGPAVRLELTQAPEPEDEVIDADGAQVFVAPSAAALDDKVLDAELESGEVHFTLHDQD